MSDFRLCIDVHHCGNAGSIHINIKQTNLELTLSRKCNRQINCKFNSKFKQNFTHSNQHNNKIIKRERERRIKGFLPAVVDFPTPPLPEAMAIVSFTPCKRRCFA